MKYDYQRLKDELERNIQENQQFIKEKSKQFDEKYNKVVIEKNNTEYALNKYREITSNNDIITLIEEARLLHLQIVNLEKDRLDIKIKVDLFDFTSNTNNNKNSALTASGRKNDIGLNSKELGSSTILRRKLEEHKDAIADIEAHVEIYHKKKTGIENELIKVLANEKQRLLESQEFEKQNHQVKLFHIFYGYILCDNLKCENK